MPPEASFPQGDVCSNFDTVTSPHLKLATNIVCSSEILEEDFSEEQTFTSQSRNVDMFFSCADWETFREGAKHKTPANEEVSSESSPLLKMNKRVSKFSAKTELYQKDAGQHLEVEVSDFNIEQFMHNVPAFDEETYDKCDSTKRQFSKNKKRHNFHRKLELS